MTVRLAILALLVLVFLLVALWLRLRPRTLSARLKARGVAADLGLNGRPSVLAFTSPDCAACEAAQRPALEELRARTGGRVEIREVDVEAAGSLVRTLGIFSLPSTVVFDRGGRVVAVNIGYASTGRLLAQLPAAARDGAREAGRVDGARPGWYK